MSYVRPKFRHPKLSKNELNNIFLIKYE
jgi:hypothetical protein